jgi:hypothetical protein
MISNDLVSLFAIRVILIFAVELDCETGIACAEGQVLLPLRVSLVNVVKKPSRPSKLRGSHVPEKKN